MILSESAASNIGPLKLLCRENNSKCFRYKQDQNEVKAEVGKETLTYFSKQVDPDDELLNEVVGNPVHIFKLLYRIHVILPDVIKDLKESGVSGKTMLGLLSLLLSSLKQFCC